MTSRRGMTAGSGAPEPESADEPPRPEDETLIKLTGTMKWFDATRGFGFLVSDDIDGDILVHFTVLKEHDRRSLPEGAVVECLVADEEAEAAGGVEPFHRSGQLDQRLVFGASGFVRALGLRRAASSSHFPARCHERPIHVTNRR